jgi:hypothetical protein
MWPRDKSGSASAARALLLVATIMAAPVSGCVNLDRPQVGLLDGPPAATDTKTDTDVVVTTDGRPDDAPDDPDAGDAPVDPDAPDAEPPPPDAEPPPPDLPPDIAPLANGRPCSTGSQCLSTQCVHGVCCESACGACRWCNTTGNEGRCMLVAAGEDPGNDCPQDPVPMCGRDGTCNGAGSCRQYPAGTECAAGRCMGTTEFAASTCNGTGTCVAGASRVCPGGGTCMGSSCGSSCTTDGNCQTGFFCDQGVCRGKRARGAACTGPSQCASGFCADNVCCSTACTENCHACNVAVAPGTCTPVPAGQDPRNVCPTDPANSCARNGACNGGGACQFYAAGATCGTSTCTNTTETLAPTCNGIGTCTPAGTRDCGAYSCSATACFTSCSNGGAQCNPGYSCAGTSCQPLGGLVLYWKLDEASGTVATDSSGGARHGTYTGVAGIPTPSTLTPPVRFSDPRSRLFDGPSRHAVRLAVMPAAIKPTAAFTASAWYRANSTDIGENTDSSEIISGGDSYILRLRVDGFEFTVRDAAGHQKLICGINGQLDNAWHHVAGVLSAAGLRVYFDGVERCSLGGSFSVVYNQGPDFWVGRHGNGDTPYDFVGHIDEVRIYNRSLSTAEIQRLAQGHSQL